MQEATFDRQRIMYKSKTKGNPRPLSSISKRFSSQTELTKHYQLAISITTSLRTPALTCYSPSPLNPNPTPPVLHEADNPVHSLTE